LLIAGLSVVVLTVAVLQTAVVPVLGHHRPPAEYIDRGGQLGGHSEPSRRGRRHPPDRSAGRPAQQENACCLRCSSSCCSARFLPPTTLVAGAADRRARVAGRLVRALPDRHRDLRRGTARGPNGVGDVRAVGDAGFRGGTGLVVVGLLMSGSAGYHPRLLADDGASRLVVIAIAALLVPARPRSSTGQSTGSGPPAWPLGCRHCCWRSRRATRGAGRPRRRWGARGCVRGCSRRLVVLGSGARSSRWCPSR